MDSAEKKELTNLYSKYDPDIILINSHCRKSPDIKIYMYTVYQSNTMMELQ